MNLNIYATSKKLRTLLKLSESQVSLIRSAEKCGLIGSNNERTRARRLFLPDVIYFLIRCDQRLPEEFSTVTQKIKP